MSINQKNNGIIREDLRDFVLRVNDERSRDYSEPSSEMKRQLYRRQHPTEILVAKCMDGRLNLSVFTGTPPGILQPFRNIGGKFHLGWPFFQEVIRDGIEYAVEKGRQCVFVSSYHFSKGDHHRGCAGFGYDTEGAKAAAFTLRDGFTGVFGRTYGRPVYSITIGIETDDESLIFHGINGESLDISMLDGSATTEFVTSALTKVYPDMDARMRDDLVPLVMGNIRHVSEVRASDKPLIDHEHREQIIAVGRGFDWLHEPNRALIIGPFSHEWTDAVKTAGNIVLGNLKAGRIPKENGVLLLVSALWRNEEREYGRLLKLEKVAYLLETARDTLLKQVPEIEQYLHVMGGVVEADTRRLHLADV